MSTPAIDGTSYARMLSGGTAVLASHEEELNALNVFPVSDGDTGSNMIKAMEGGLAQIGGVGAGESLGDVSKRFTRGVLLSARGNSGVILSQIFAGINEVLGDCVTADADKLAKAYEKGIAKAYAAVQNPTEGTILTVFRESTEYAAKNVESASCADDFYRLHLADAKRSLLATKEILPVLAEADVVDSGAAGYVYITEGMYDVLCGSDISYSPAAKKESAGVNVDLFTRDSVLEFGYCTEFLLRLTAAKVADPDAFDVQTLVSELSALGGESIVAYKQDDVVKVHVHTFTPGTALDAAQKYGEFLTLKIENMSLGHTERIKPEKKSAKNYSVVAVAAGEGMAALFGRLGADRVICVRDGENPSVEDFLGEFALCGTKDVIVLPDHKNIMLAAQRAAEMYKDAKVRVVPCKNFMQGFSALSVLTPGITDADTLTECAERAAGGVTCVSVTAAVRDAVIDGMKISKGDCIAICDGKIAAAEKSAEDAVFAALEKADTELCEIVTLFAGKNVLPERRAALTEKIKAAYPELETVVYEGGQDVYDYYVAIE